MSRYVDHLVLPVSSLEHARSRLSSLGFTVAVDAEHPFGTQNACVFFRNETYLEPLAIGEPEKYHEFAEAGNAFIRLDKLFRQHAGQEGLSALVAKSDSADLDHQRFVSQNMSGGKPFSFSRPMILPDGTASEASFRLAFASSHTKTDFFFFTCQRIAVPSIDRSSLEHHENGAAGICEVVLSADEPARFALLVEAVFGAAAVVEEGGALCFQTSNVCIRIVTPSKACLLLDGPLQHIASGLFGAGIVFSVSDLAVTAALLAANGVGYTRKGARLLVQPAIGQGATFAFEES